MWPEVRDAGTSGAGAVPLRSAQMVGQQKKTQTNKPISLILRHGGLDRPRIAKLSK